LERRLPVTRSSVELLYCALDRIGAPCVAPQDKGGTENRFRILSRRISAPQLEEVFGERRLRVIGACRFATLKSSKVSAHVVPSRLDLIFHLLAHHMS
jgi:hypothetical protein